MKTNQKGFSVITVLLLCVVGGIITLAAFAISNYLSYSNYAASIESKLEALFENNKNIMAQGQQRVLEIAQVPGMYRDDYAKLVHDDISGRYGADGAKAQMLWLKERNLNFDSSMHQKIQQEVAAFRIEYQNAQTVMLDVRRQYAESLDRPYDGFWLRLAGRPKVNLDKYKPITTAGVETTYANGREDGPMKLR